MKKSIALILSLCMLLSLMAGCAQKETTSTEPAAAVEEAPAEEVQTEETAEPEASSEEIPAAEEPVAETRSFTDSLGRTVELPADLTKIAVSGPLAQIALFALCPDKMVGIATEWNEIAADYFDEKYYNLPILGQLYGGKGDFNPESLLASGAEIVIDVGEPKDSAADDLDALQEQTGVPFVHVTLTIATAGEAYRLLGELVGMPEEAEELAAYCERVYAQTLAISESVEKVNALFVTGDEGHNVIAQGSYHSEVFDLLTNNLAVVDEPSSKGTGNEVDMEQILTWNPDYIIFAPESVYSTVADDSIWQSVTAIQNGNYYEVPFGPYNWMGFPPSVQRFLGMLWLAKTLYPEAAEYDLYEEVAEYFDLFYHCELTQEQFDALMPAAIAAANAA